MSLILEALRKSEAERQRAQGPGLHAPAALRRVEREPIGPGPWVAVAVAVALLAGTWWVNRPQAAPPPFAAAEPPPASAPAVSPPPPPQVGEVRRSDEPAPPPPAPPKPRERPQPEPVGVPPVALPAPTEPPAPVAAATAPAEPAPTAPDEPALADAPPPIAALPADQRASLPPLKISVFVWSADPAHRFAIVDGQRVGEGGLLAGGTVAEIRPDGVVLDLGGRRWLLARP